MKKHLLAATLLVAMASPSAAQNIGDVVYLKSGGPPVTVTEILPRPDASGTDVGVKWFGGLTMMAATFPATALVVVDPLPVIVKDADAERCRVLLLKDPTAKC